MITRAIIKSIFGNKCSIEVPLFSNDNSNSIPVLPEAVMMIPPGMIGQYAEGDVVIISFEENMFGRPIVLGKLYTGANSAKQASATILSRNTEIETVDITTQAEITKTTSIGALLDTINNLKARVEALEGYSPSTVYTITYNLNGGTIEEPNPTTYTTADEFTLNQPTKDEYIFEGWTGTNGNVPAKTITITAGSIGNRHYTANWSYDR